MNGYHWGGIIVLLLIGYFIGIYMPGPGQMVRGKLGV
jgi:hypothetical protein